MMIGEIPEQEQRAISQLAPGISAPQRLELRGDVLVWEAGHNNYVSSDKIDGHELLTSFAALADEAKPERFLAFARRWGVLGICRLHGCPVTFCAPQNFDNTPFDKRCGYQTWLEELPKDSLTSFYSPPRKAYWGSPQYYSARFVCSEPIAAWRPLAAEVRAVLNLTLSINNDDPGNVHDWATLQSSNGPFAGKPGLPDGSGYRSWWFKVNAWLTDSDPSKMKKLSESLGNSLEKDDKTLSRAAQIRVGRGHLAEVVNDWLESACLRPYFFWDGHSGKRTFWLHAPPGGQLIGTISTQLMFTVHGTPGFAICAKCKQPTLLRPHQSAIRDVYCDRPYCGRKAALAAASKRYRDNNRANKKRKRRPVAKLTPAQSQLVKRRLAKVDRPLRTVVLELAERHKVSPATIYRHAKLIATNLKGHEHGRTKTE